MYSPLLPICQLLTSQSCSTSTSSAPFFSGSPSRAMFTELSDSTMELTPVNQADDSALPSSSSFLDLPAETRLKIYGYLFSKGIVKVTDLVPGSSFAFNTVDRRLSILLTYRTCYGEVQPISHRTTRFDIQIAWLNTMLEEMHNSTVSFFVTHVRYFRLSSHDDGYPPAL